MLLRNQERYLEVLDLSADGQWQRRVVDSEDDIRANGVFFDHGGTIFGLGVSHGAIVVLLRDRVITCGVGFETQIREDGECRVFTAIHDGVPLVSVTYSPVRPSWNFFAMEDEDVDGFLWIHNVLSSDERRAIFLKHNAG